MSYEEAMEKYGTGRYQLIIFVLLSSVSISTACNNNGYIFMGATQRHNCSVPESNWTVIDNTTVPVVYAADICTYGTYAKYDENTTELIEKKVQCDSWNYDQSEFTLTIMSEWDLNSCDGKWKIAVASSMYMIGFLIGCIVLADLADRYGRSLLLLISNLGMLLTAVIAAFSVNFEMLAVVRLLLGIFTAGARNAAYVYICEIVCQKYRPTACILSVYGYVVGTVVITGIAQGLRVWRHIQLACGLSYLVFIPYYWLMPESPRWMLSQGRHKETKAYFKRSARINKIETPLPKNLTVYLDAKPKTEGNIFALFKTPNLRKKTITVCIQWFSVSIVYFGMVFNVGNLGGNIYVTNYVLSISGVFVFLSVFYAMLGRRNALSSTFIISSGFSAGLLAFSHYNSYAGVLAMCLLGATFIGNGFTMIYVATSELYPTTARVTALGLGSCLARVGGALSPYLVLSNDLWPGMPYVLFGAIALLAGLTAIWLPETKGKPLPDSLHQAETEIPLNTCCCGR